MEDVFSAPYSSDQVYIYNWVIPDADWNVDLATSRIATTLSFMRKKGRNVDNIKNIKLIIDSTRVQE